jgi:hypothetical protein
MSQTRQELAEVAAWYAKRKPACDCSHEGPICNEHRPADTSAILPRCECGKVPEKYYQTARELSSVKAGNAVLSAFPPDQIETEPALKFKERIYRREFKKYMPRGNNEN